MNAIAYSPALLGAARDIAARICRSATSRYLTAPETYTLGAEPGDLSDVRSALGRDPTVAERAAIPALVADAVEERLDDLAERAGEPAEL